MSNQEQQFIAVSNGILSPDSIAAFLADPSNFNRDEEEEEDKTCWTCKKEYEVEPGRGGYEGHQCFDCFEKENGADEEEEEEDEFRLYSYQEQLAKCKDPSDDFGNVWRNHTWTIADYEEFFEDVDRGYVIQGGDFDGGYFVINEDYEDYEE